MWTTARGVSYTPSPLLHDGRLYIVSDAGLLSSLDAATGKPHYQQRRLPEPSQPDAPVSDQLIELVTVPGFEPSAA